MSIIEDKSEVFADCIVKLYKQICKEKKEYVISKQILRSGTSIYANVTEAEYAQSKRDFYAKMYIAQKEAAETRCWLKLLYNNEYITEKEFKYFIGKNIEIINILVAITKTQKKTT